MDTFKAITEPDGIDGPTGAFVLHEQRSAVNAFDVVSIAKLIPGGRIVEICTAPWPSLRDVQHRLSGDAALSVSVRLVDGVGEWFEPPHLESDLPVTPDPAAVARFVERRARQIDSGIDLVGPKLFYPSAVRERLNPRPSPSYISPYRMHYYDPPPQTVNTEVYSKRGRRQ